MTPKQAKDIECIQWFIPKWIAYPAPTQQDIDDFLSYSERGIGRSTTGGIQAAPVDGYTALMEGKRWRGIHIGMYEEGVMSGDVPYHAMLGEGDKELMPRVVVDYLKKELFQGIDAELIERTYLELIEERKAKPVTLTLWQRIKNTVTKWIKKVVN